MSSKQLMHYCYSYFSPITALGTNRAFSCRRTYARIDDCALRRKSWQVTILEGHAPPHSWVATEFGVPAGDLVAPLTTRSTSLVSRIARSRRFRFASMLYAQ